MKKTLFSNFLILLVASTLSLSNTLAEDPTQWNLPEDAKARLGKGKITEILYSPDGKFLAVAGGIGIWLYDTPTYQEGNLLTDHTSEVESIAFSRDGHMIASGSVDGPITLWDRRTGALTTFTGHTDIVWSVIFSPDGKTLASGDGNHNILLWDIDTGKAKMVLTAHTDWVQCLAFSPDGKILASGNRDRTIYLWDAHTGEQKKILKGHTDWVRSIAFSPDGKTLVSGSGDGTVLLWEINP